MSSSVPDRRQGSLSTEGKAAGAPRKAEKGQCLYRRPGLADPAGHWEVLSQAYQRLTEAFLAQPALPPVDELDAFSALAVRSLLSPHEIVALHYATLNQLLAGDERYAAESLSASRRALISVLLRLMGEYRRSSGDAAARSAGR